MQSQKIFVGLFMYSKEDFLLDFSCIAKTIFCWNFDAPLTGLFVEDFSLLLNCWTLCFCPVKRICVFYIA